MSLASHGPTMARPFHDSSLHHLCSGECVSLTDCKFVDPDPETVSAVNFSSPTAL